MPLRQGRGGRGGGVLGLGPEQNTFGDATTTDRAAAEALRDTYQGNNAAWLAQYNGNRSFWIRLAWDDGTIEQRRNAAGTGWEDVTNVIRGPAGADGAEGHLGLLQFFAPGNAEALPAQEAARNALVYVQNPRSLRYRANQNAPDAVLAGSDPGIRALAAADAAEADLMTGGNNDEVLPDYAVFEVPAGVLTRAKLTAQHDAASDVSLVVFAYEVRTGGDDIIRNNGIGYSAGVADPLATQSRAQTPSMGFEISTTIDARAAAKRVTWISAGFNGSTDANGHWLWEFEILEAP